MTFVVLNEAKRDERLLTADDSRIGKTGTFNLIVGKSTLYIDASSTCLY